MIPKEYEFFCRMQRVEGCSYLNSQDCKGTCNLAKEAELEDNINSEYKDVLSKTKNIKIFIHQENYKRFDN